MPFVTSGDVPHRSEFHGTMLYTTDLAIGYGIASRFEREPSIATVKIVYVS